MCIMYKNQKGYIPFLQLYTTCIYSTLQVYQRSYSQVRHIPPKMSDKFESQHSLSPTIWSDVRVDIKRFFFTFLEVNMSNIL